MCILIGAYRKSSYCKGKSPLVRIFYKLTGFRRTCGTEFLSTETIASFKIHAKGRKLIILCVGMIWWTHKK